MIKIGDIARNRSAENIGRQCSCRLNSLDANEFGSLLSCLRRDLCHDVCHPSKLHPPLIVRSLKLQV